MKKLSIVLTLVSLIVLVNRFSRTNVSTIKTANNAATLVNENPVPDFVSQSLELETEVPVGKEIVLKTSELKINLVNFYIGSQKAIVTRLERKRLDDIMSDRNIINQAFARLSTKENTFNKNHEFDRMNAVFFITRSIQWKNNPSREYAIQQAERFVLGYITQRQLPLRLQKSIAADHVEIYKALLENDANAAHKLERQAENLDAIKIINFAKEFYT